jgi:hypothetical protein
VCGLWYSRTRRLVIGRPTLRDYLLLHLQDRIESPNVDTHRKKNHKFHSHYKVWSALGYCAILWCASHQIFRITDIVKSKHVQLNVYETAFKLPECKHISAKRYRVVRIPVKWP